MVNGWEWEILGVGIGALVLWVALREVFEVRLTSRWAMTHFPHWFPQPPIYGPADPYRTKGPDAMPNRRRVIS